MADQSIPTPFGVLTLVGQAQAVTERQNQYLAADSGVLFLLGFGADITQVFKPPPNADSIANGVIRYDCLLTGAADGLDDLVLPISSLSVRHRVETDSYYSIVIPSISYSEAIAARANGQIVVSMTIGTTAEETLRGSLGTVQMSNGPMSQSLSISGNASRAAHTRATYELDAVLYAYSTSDGEQRLRIPPRAAMRPGDTVLFGGSYFRVRLVTLTASPKNTTMEVAIS